MTNVNFSVTWDYRCPFARNAHEHILDALEAGADWNVTFVPFSLNQPHVAEGEPSVFEDPKHAADLLAMEVGIVVRDRFPQSFLQVHRSLFGARHDAGITLKEEPDLRRVLAAGNVDGDAVFAEIEAGWPRKTFAEAHQDSVYNYEVFGVPTFILDGQAAFARIMTRPHGDADLARDTIDRILDLVVGHPELNEVKHTTTKR
ncbi:MAG: DsbA family protein [Acidimicrobiales bacterium]